MNSTQTEFEFESVWLPCGHLSPLGFMIFKIPPFINSIEVIERADALAKTRNLHPQSTER
jgi:hypothetical protein